MPKRSKVFSISRAEHAELQRWRRVRNTPHSLAQRARLILLLADGVAPVDIMATLDVTRPTVFKWRKRFEQDGVDGLRDRPRPGQPRKVTEKKFKEVLRLTVDYIPREATHWSTRLMAKYADVTQYQVREIWKAADLRPHRLKTFKISNDPQFAEKVIDVVGLYMDPPDNAMVLSVDEKTQIQALDHTQPMLPLRPGQIERRTHDYTRHGTASLYAAFDIASGEIMGRVTRRHRAREFLAFLRQIDKAVPDELDVHLILDNSSTHKTKAVQRWLTARPRFHTHFTPTSASWLNAVEGWFAQLERRALQRGTFTSVAELREAIRQFIKAHNVETAKPFRWTASANAIIAATNRAKQHAAA
ncbi:MAG: IS630 family transposase [Woeseia sp.]